MKNKFERNIFHPKYLNFGSQVLLWSRGKSLYEVRKFLGRPNPEKFEEINEERRTSVLDEKIDIFSKEESSCEKYFISIKHFSIFLTCCNAAC